MAAIVIAGCETPPWTDVLASALASRVQKIEEGKPPLDGKLATGADDKGEAQWRVSTDYLLSDVLGLPKERQHNTHTKRLADAMRSLGWKRNDNSMRIGTKVQRGYFKERS